MNSKQISKIFRPFTKIPGIRFMFGKLYHTLILDRIVEKEIAQFQAAGLYVLKEFDDIMKASNVKYSLIWGSMLGAVRDKGFIKHDFDIDVAIWKRDYCVDMHTLLVKNGFKHIQRFTVDNGMSAMEETYEKNGVSIDIFYIYNDEKGSYTCTFETIGQLVDFEDSIRKYGNINIYKYYLDFPEDFEYVPFENIQMPIPFNADELLKLTYGQDYMIPQKKWSRDPNIKRLAKWENKQVVYKKYS